MPASSRSRVAKRKSGVSGTQDEQYNPTARQRFSARPKSVGRQQAGAHSGLANTEAGSAPASPDTVQREALMTEEEKREDRARRNRASALKSRNKRRQRLAFLEAEYAKLRGVVEKLAGEKARLQVENVALKRAAAAAGDGAAGDDATTAAHCSGVAVLTPRATCLTPPPSPGPPRRRHARTAADAGAPAAATTTAPASAPAPDARACSRTPPPPPFAAPPRVSDGNTGATAPHTTAAGAGGVVKPAPLRRLPQPLALARLSRVCTFEDFLTAFGDATVSSRGTGDSDTTSCNSSGSTAATTSAMTTAGPASACALAPNSSTSTSTANNDNDSTCTSSSTGDEDPFNSFLRCFDASSGGGSFGLDPSSGGASLLWQLDAADNAGATRDNGDFTGGPALPPAPSQRQRRQQQQNSLLPVAGFPRVMQCRSPRLFAQSSRPSAASSGGGSHRSGLGRMISA